MNFEEYEKIIETFAVYPRDNELTAISHLALGSNSEAGEVADQVKRAIRSEGRISAERQVKILDEIGDALWYITRLAIECDTPLSQIAQANVDKLKKRRAKSL